MTPSDPFRAFFAVPLAPPVAEALAAAAGEALEAAGASFDEWRVTPAERVHITLRFLGDTPLGRRGALLEALREAVRAPGPGARMGARMGNGPGGGGEGGALPPFPIGFRGWHLLPGNRDPRILAAAVSDPSGTLPRLAGALEASARWLSGETGYPADSAGAGRPFLSHATVARKRRGRRGRRRDRRGAGGRDGGVTPRASWERLAAATGPLAGDQVVDRVVLMASSLGPQGPVYEVLEEVLLQGSG